MRRGIILAVGLVLFPGFASSQGAVQPWGNVTAPAPPLHEVTLEPARTALLVLDFSEPCAERPRCLATLPAELKMIHLARSLGAMVIYSEVTGELGSALPDFLARPGSVVVKSGPDKFVGTRLADLLAANRVTTVTLTGTAAEGAVLDTGLDAALREGLKVVVPVDLISSATPYGEQMTEWDFANAPGISAHAVLTRSGMIGF